MEDGNAISDELLAQANRIFMAAVEIDSDNERKAFIDQSCQSNPVLRSRVDRLFSFQEKANPVFKALAPAELSTTEIVHSLSRDSEFLSILDSALSDDDDDDVGKQIGNYKLLRKIGEGGVGNVYLAEQSNPVRRQVALKIIKTGMDTKNVIARFEAERQALAMMEHPNIAHVLNAGATDNGRPFFVMELVQGEKITTYCDQHGLNVARRLDLFIQVCHAIQHAHQKGIIHRDIKPSNVLVSEVDGAPFPVVIDFGIAKVIGEDLMTENTMQTLMDSVIGTPCYMSPEQANHSNTYVDMRSDIYSLGVLLYELLVGTPPFNQRQLVERGVNEMRRILSFVDPPRPSVLMRQLSIEQDRQIMDHYSTDAHKLASMLSGDLDWIIMKAMEKDRDRRYEAANVLAMDIAHFLNNEPVIARPPSRMYRFGKLVRRNRVVFAMGTLIVIALCIGFGTSSWLFLRERQVRKRAIVAEQAQSQLRLEAEDRERVAQAAYFLIQSKAVEADETVDNITTITPSLEAESVFRTLGEWHALNGRWKLSAKRFKLLLTVDIKDQSWTIADDLMMAGPILIERGDHSGYEAFRRAALSRYQGTTDPAFAERTLKICLLLPADEEMMEQLRAFVPVAENGPEKRAADRMPSWRCTSLALMAYRDHRYNDSIVWCGRSRASEEVIPASISSADVIEAMARYRLGEMETARQTLSSARIAIEAELSNELKKGVDATGLWYDWLTNRILLREAEALIEQPSLPESDLRS